MAIVLKADKTFTPGASAKMGVDVTSDIFYGVIHEVRYHKGIKKCLFVVEIYGSRELSKEPNPFMWDKIQFGYEDGQEVNGEMTNPFTDQIGISGLTIPEAYTKALETLTDWESDEA